MSGTAVRIVAAGAILLLAAANIRSVAWGAMVQNVSTVAKVSALVGLAILAFVLGNVSLGAFGDTMALSPISWGGFGVALIAVLWAYDGWADLTFMGGEVRDPARTLPRALLGGTLGIIVIYLVVNAAYLFVLSVDEMAGRPLVAADAARRIFGEPGAAIVAAMVLLSAFGALNGATMTGPRIFFAMADDGLFFKPIASVHPSFRTPWAAIALAAGLGPVVVVLGRRESHIRPERFARLVTLAGILIDTARESSKLGLQDLCERLQISEQELRQDIDVLNVVNFGGGSYVLYAEIQGDQIEVDPEPYGDNFARPARLLPLEAKALVAAIDLVGEHLPEGSLTSARDKIVKALGNDPAHDGLQITSAKGDDSEIARVVSSAIADRRLLAIEHYKEAEDDFTKRTIEPYQLLNGPEGWYVHAFEPAKDQSRSFRLDRIRSADVLGETFEPREGIEPEMGGWPTTGEVPASVRARVWISPERARWAREDKRVVDELKDGAVIVELPYASNEYLAREILKETGDAVVLEPEDARDAVRSAAESLAGAVRR